MSNINLKVPDVKWKSNTIKERFVVRTENYKVDATILQFVRTTCFILLELRYDNF